MKQISTKNKIIGIVSILIVIIALIVVIVGGFNVERKYQSYKKISIYVGEEVDIEKIEKVVNDTLGKNKATVQKIEIYNDTFQVIAKEITEEQKNTIVDKINELYPITTVDNNVENTETSVRVKKEDIQIVSASNVRLRDVFKPYIMPFVIATLCIIVYVAIRYRKIGVIRVILETIGVLLGVQILLLSVLAIIRFPMGRFTPALILIAYIMSVIYISNRWKNMK
jgi:preprotein translocase subunit SecF